MISSQKEEIFWVFDFVGQQEADGLQWLLSSVHIVSQKEIIGFWRESTIFEKSQKIIVLSVYISANFDRGFEFQQGWLRYENFPRF